MRGNEGKSGSTLILASLMLGRVRLSILEIKRAEEKAGQSRLVKPSYYGQQI